MKGLSRENFLSGGFYRSRKYLVSKYWELRHYRGALHINREVLSSHSAH